jgi:hypothetical protein
MRKINGLGFREKFATSGVDFTPHQIARPPYFPDSTRRSRERGPLITQAFPLNFFYLVFGDREPTGNLGP